MPPQTPTDTPMHQLIQELDHLQLPPPAKAYFVSLLKHIDARDKEWAKVVKMWETYEGSKADGPDRAMIEIMSSVQEIFMGDDGFLKGLYKGRMEELGATRGDDGA